MSIKLAAQETLSEKASAELWYRGFLTWKLWPQQRAIYNTVRELPRTVQTVVILCARQFGKCLEINTLASTPRGPIAIQNLEIGQEIYGYNKDGSIGLTKVVAKKPTGIRTVHDLINHGRPVASVTAEHRFLSTWKDNKTSPRKFAELTSAQIIRGRGRKIVRRLIDAPLGDVECREAYVVGAFIGNGCKTGGLRRCISSPDIKIPERCAGILGVELYKNGGPNFTWVLSHSTGRARAKKIEIPYAEWFECYSHEKYLDRSVIEAWDRESCLKLLAGLTDTDGSVIRQLDGCLRWSYSTSSKRLAEDVQWLVYRLFQREPGVTAMNRKKRTEYTCHVISNLHASRIVKQISPFMVTAHKRWQQEYEHLSFRNCLEDSIGITSAGTRQAECWDIQVDNETNLYLLHNEGLVTHNSVMGVLLAMEDCLQNPGVIVMIIGPTIKQTRAIVRPRAKLLMHDAPLGLIKALKSDDTWYFSNGSELKLGGFDTNSAAQRGKTIHKIYMEETCDSEGDDYLDFLQSDLGPALTHSAHAQIIHLTTLPKIPDHPFVLETVPEAEMNGAFFKFTIHDNKKLSPEKFAQCVKIAGGVHSIAFKREYLCEQVRDGSIILTPEFDESKHVMEIKAPEYCFYWIGGDTGGIRDMSVFHLCGYDFKRDKILFLDERSFSPDTGSDIMAAAVFEMEGGRKVTRHVDAAGQLQIDLAHQHKFICSLPRKDELEASINQLRVALQTLAIEIDPKCKLLITTLRSGTYNHNRTDLARSKTLGHMDAAMSAVYAIRHANKSNPYPVYNGASHFTHYIKETEQNKNALGFKKAFGSSI